MNTKDVVLLVIGSHALVAFLFVSDKLLGNRPDRLSLSYYLRAFITSIAVLGLMVALSWVARAMSADTQLLLRIAQVIAFVAACWIVKVILMGGASLDRALWVTLVVWILTLIVDAISGAVFKASIW